MPARTKFRPGDRVRVNDRAPLDYAEREGLVIDRAPGTGGYRVRFSDGAVFANCTPCPTEGYLDSAWLESVASADQGVNRTSRTRAS